MLGRRSCLNPLKYSLSCSERQQLFLPRLASSPTKGSGSGASGIVCARGNTIHTCQHANVCNTTTVITSSYKQKYCRQRETKGKLYISTWAGNPVLMHADLGVYEEGDSISTLEYLSRTSTLSSWQAAGATRCPRSCLDQAVTSV